MKKKPLFQLYCDLRMNYAEKCMRFMLLNYVELQPSSKVTKPCSVVRLLPVKARKTSKVKRLVVAVIVPN